MQSELDLGIGWRHQSATFSEHRRYRYSLVRRKGGGGPGKRWVTFCMLNPSTADEKKNDPTVRRCIGYADRWGFDALTIVNIFALRSTDPKQLYKDDDPIGDANDRCIIRGCYDAEFVVCAWGAHGTFKNRGNDVIELLRRENYELRRLGLTKAKQPKHPLYLRADTKPQGF